MTKVKGEAMTKEQEEIRKALEVLANALLKEEDSPHSEKGEISETSDNVLDFPTNVNEDGDKKRRLALNVNRIKEIHDAGNLNSMFALIVHENQSMDVMYVGGKLNLKTYLLAASLLDSMRSHIINQSQAQVFGAEDKPDDAS